jgi:hypothetical protein
VINKRTLKFQFATIDLTYTGAEKSVEVTVSPNSIAQGDSVAPVVQYDGDRINVSALGFKVSVVGLTGTSASNYTFLEDQATNTYIITPATITGVEFNNVSVDYNASEHIIEISGFDETTMTVNYSVGTRYTIPGIYNVTAVVSKANHNDLELDAYLEIRRCELPIASENVLVDNKDNLYYGGAMPRLVDQTGSGTLAFTSKNKELVVGQMSYEWVYTPEDSNYLTSTGTIVLNVKKAITSIKVEDDKNVTVDQIKAATVIIGNKVLGANQSNTTIVYILANGEETTVEPTAPGKYTAIVKFAGDENYESTEYTVPFEIPGSNSAYITVWVVIGVILGTIMVGIVIASARKRSRMK